MGTENNTALLTPTATYTRVRVAGTSEVTSLAETVRRACESTALVKVNNEDTAILASTRLCSIDQAITCVAELYDESVADANKLHKGLTGKRNTFLTPLQVAKREQSAELGSYHADKARKAAAVREAARLEAVKAAEEERLRSAEALETMGRTEDADAIMEAPINVAPVVAAPNPTLPPGQSVRQNWKFEIVDPAALPREYLMPDEKTIGIMVRSMKARTNIPGVRVYAIESVTTRRPPAH